MLNINFGHDGQMQPPRTPRPSYAYRRLYPRQMRDLKHYDEGGNIGDGERHTTSSYHFDENVKVAWRGITANL